jgi:hypothetical protein
LASLATASVSSYYSGAGTLAQQMAALTDPAPSPYYYNSGGFAPSSIELVLPGLYTITTVCLEVAQLPDGITHHQLYVGSTSPPTQLASDLYNYTYSGEWINITYSPPLYNVTYLLLETLLSPSWVAWIKFLVY